MEMDDPDRVNPRCFTISFPKHSDLYNEQVLDADPSQCFLDDEGIIVQHIGKSGNNNLKY